MSWKVTNLQKIENSAALGQGVKGDTRVGFTEKRKILKDSYLRN